MIAEDIVFIHGEEASYESYEQSNMR